MKNIGGSHLFLQEESSSVFWACLRTKFATVALTLETFSGGCGKKQNGHVRSLTFGDVLESLCGRGPMLARRR